MLHQKYIYSNKNFMIEINLCKYIYSNFYLHLKIKKNGFHLLN